MYAIFVTSCIYIIGAIFFGTASLFSGETNQILYVLGWIFLIAGVVSTLGFTIGNLVKNNDMNLRTSQIITQKRKIQFAEEKYDVLKEYYEKQVLEVFPKFEKTLLEKISPANNKELLALMNEYPDLQSYKLLKDLMEKITSLVNTIYNQKNYLESSYEEIRQYIIDPWILVRIKVQEDLLNEANKLN